MNSILIVVGLIALLLLIFFYFIEPKILRLKANNDNEYGSARFATFKEIDKTFTKESISNINEVGFPILYSKDNKYVWFDKETPHWCFLGSTGSGKSVTAVIPMCSFIATANKKRSVFITDPKGEIYQTTSKMFKDNGYKIITIDFRNPELSNKINLLKPIVSEYKEYIVNEKKANEIEEDLQNKNPIYTKEELLNYKNLSMKHLAESNRLITSLSQMIVNDEGKEKDPFWNNSARNLLEGLIGLFLEEYKDGKINENQITLTSIKKFQNSSMNEDNFEELKEYIDKKAYGTKSKDSLASIYASAENTYKSIVSTLSEKMSLFDDVNVANITSTSDFEFDILGKETTAFYIIVPDEDKTYYKLITIIIGLLYRELVKLANSNKDKKLPIQIDWLLDEFANCPPLKEPSIESIVSVARSRGMRFQFFIQSLSQLDNVYGKDVAQIILDNCGLVYLKTNTQETAEAISKRLGKKTIESNSVSQSVGKVTYDGNRTYSLIGRDLLTPEEVKQLHYKTIIFPIIGYPIFRDTVIYKKFSCYSSGDIKRTPQMLKDLSNTYYTVEDLNQSKKVDEIENKEEYNFFVDGMKEIYKDIEENIRDILTNQKYEISYPSCNYSIYCKIVVDNIICGDDRDRINSLAKDLFIINIEVVNDTSIISIYKK